MKHKTRHVLPKKIFFIAIAISILLLVRWLVTNDRVPIFELNLRWILLSVVLLLGFLAAFISYFEYHGIGCQDGILRRGERLPFVSITFDDGPNLKHTPKILDVLKEKNAKATFFVVGKNVEKYPEIARRIVEEGHDIASHTYSHKELVPSTRKTIIKELTKTDEAIKKATGVSTDLFRPPRGIYSQASRQLLVEMGYKIILWSVSSVDWRKTTPSWILNRVRRYARMGSIILFHDGGALVRGENGKRISTVKALPMVIDYLRSQELEIIPISTMMRQTSYKEDEAQTIIEDIEPAVTQKN